MPYQMGVGDYLQVASKHREDLDLAKMMEVTESLYSEIFGMDKIFYESSGRTVKYNGADIPEHIASVFYNERSSRGSIVVAGCVQTPRKAREIGRLFNEMEMVLGEGVRVLRAVMMPGVPEAVGYNLSVYYGKWASDGSETDYDNLMNILNSLPAKNLDAKRILGSTGEKVFYVPKSIQQFLLLNLYEDSRARALQISLARTQEPNK